MERTAQDAGERTEFWQRLAKVAMGLQGDDPVNWPHYADEARRLAEEHRARGDALETLLRIARQGRIDGTGYVFADAVERIARDALGKAESNPLGGASRGVGRCTCAAGSGTNPACPVHP